MNYILKNVRVTHEANEYLIFNEANKTQSKFTDTPEIAKAVQNKFGLMVISPIKAQWSGFFNFKRVKLSDYETN